MPLLARSQKRVGASLAIVCGLLATICMHCAETRRSLGEECLRNEDCLSDVCSARSCVNPPPTTTSSAGSTLPPPATLDANVADAHDGGG